MQGDKNIMNSKVAQAAMIVAAVAAMNAMHIGQKGERMNRQEFRRRYGKKKGGGRGLGMINGLPKVCAYSTELGNNPEAAKYHPELAARNWHRDNRSVGMGK